ncbi:MAG: RDD family protein [Acidobacteria bacterium]|nr:MAG: RDD family protein [Acidobacteriota bacterium]REK01371.1 MAG: RDD family protein [Acidobacteriota bacterium]REK14327.1 MAG: RDD family protein [Acidobacteriota bacterium]REK45042.1 MAG: RDD family protein [Acidobacteriota bacterium]
MVSNKKKPRPRNRIKTTRVVVGFDPEELKAPFLLRCGALLIDYIVLIIVPVITLLLARWSGYDGSKLLNSSLSNSGWLVTFVIAICNFLVLPAFTGQSIGKLLTGIKIASRDGTTAGFGALALRHFVGYPSTLLTFGLGFIWSALSPSGRALHDYIAGTVVVYGRKSVSEKRYVKKSESEKK